jgi:hypothetical protein
MRAGHPSDALVRGGGAARDRALSAQSTPPRAERRFTPASSRHMYFHTPGDEPPAEILQGRIGSIVVEHQGSCD